MKISHISPVKLCPPTPRATRKIGAPQMVDLNWAYCPPVEPPSSQRHFRVWVLGHAWNIYLNFSPTPPLIFTYGKNVKNSVFHKIRIRVTQVLKASNISEILNLRWKLDWLAYVPLKFGAGSSTQLWDYESGVGAP